MEPGATRCARGMRETPPCPQAPGGSPEGSALQPGAWGMVQMAEGFQKLACAAPGPREGLQVDKECGFGGRRCIKGMSPSLVADPSARCRPTCPACRGFASWFRSGRPRFATCRGPCTSTTRSCACCKPPVWRKRCGRCCAFLPGQSSSIPRGSLCWNGGGRRPTARSVGMKATGLHLSVRAGTACAGIYRTRGPAGRADQRAGAGARWRRSGADRADRTAARSGAVRRAAGASGPDGTAAAG